jgi:DNA-binding winged helix-turn-helix (wHTH) protein/tetratricopeptide (TPR) repeat protein
MAMLYRFAGFDLDADRLELRHGRRRLALQPKALRLLLFLVRNADRAVAKSELFEQVWPGTRTVESALTRAVTLLRSELRKHVRETVVETVRGTGYRIAAPVTVENPAGELATGTGREPTFLGRERELAELLEPLRRGSRAGTRICVMNGEAGIGKTALARELALRASELGARVFWGRCDAATGAYGPWREILRVQLGSPAAIAALRRAGTAAGALALGIPEVRLWSAAVPAPPALSHERARREFFAALVRLQASLAESAPLWLVIDDVQWADLPSVRLVRELVATAAHLPIFVLVTRREGEQAASDGIDAELARAARAASRSSQLRLKGLLQSDLERLISLTARRGLRRADVRAIYQRAGGNPLFAQELTRLYLSRPDSVSDPLSESPSVPTGVRELLLRRLSIFDASTRALLQAASVVGPAFRLELLARAAEREPAEVLATLEQVESARVIEPVRERDSDFRFAHELFRETIYDDMPTFERVRIHRRVAEHLESTAPGDVAALAHHHGRAAVAGDYERALDCALRAAAEASERLAFESAAAMLESALRILERHAPADARRRAELLVAVGDAHHHSGDPARAESVWWQAVHAGRDTRGFEASAGAAVRLSKWGIGNRGRVPSARIEVLEEALRKLPAERQDLRALVLAALGADLHWVGRDLARPRALAEEAVALARRSGSAEALLVALDQRYFSICRGEDFAERARLTDESIALARSTGDLAQLFVAENHRVALRTALGDLAGALSGFTGCVQLAQELRRPAFDHYVRVATTGFDLLAGRVEGAAEAIERQLKARLDDSPRDVDFAFMFLYAQLFQLRRLQGRLPELIPHVREACARFPDVRAFRGCLALAQWLDGEPGAARDTLEQALPTTECGLREDIGFPIQLAMLGEVCAELGDPARATQLETRLADFEGRHLVLNTVVSAGAADRVRGALAASIGEFARARACFARALALDEALEAVPWRILTELSWARAEQRAGERAAAERHAASARALGLSHGLAALT